ncbi:hypothetical protein SESBI_11154 [Sesbania bispinosa]|nr:hypothetical protein SESBI_11154 [Sesbania bispinosa]
MNGLFNMIGTDAIFSNPRDHPDAQITEIKCADPKNPFNISFTVPTSSFDHWMGPAIRLSLPSFSGLTQYNPNLLKYACQIECRVRAMQPLKVSGATQTSNEDSAQYLENHGSSSKVAGEHKNDLQNFSTYVILSKPILALKFSQMKMQVEAPTAFSVC